MTVDSIRDRIRDAVRNGAPLRIRGGGTKDFYGASLEGDVLDVGAHAGIIAYEPTELFVTARAGTKLDDLERTLDEQGQMLAFEPPQFGEGSTIGGVVAAGLSGPRRAQAGALRDFVLGAQIVDGSGELLNFGGRVMKNVAGYDVSRLMCGALGTLGVITQVTLKVVPKPAAELSLRYELPQATALTMLNEWAAQPLPISASAWHDGVLTLRLSGAVAGIAAARAQLGGEAVADVEARDFWNAVRHHAHAFFTAATLWRLSVPSTAAPIALPGATLVEWNGGQRWLRSDADAATIRAAALAAGGAATLFRGDDALKRSAGVFASLPKALAELHRRTKRTFDPHGVLNRGRLYPDL